VLRLVAEGLTLAAAIARVASAGAGALPVGEGEALLFGQILQAASQGIWVAKGGRTRYVNRRMAEIMGYSVEQLVAIPVLDFFAADELPIVKERTAQVRSGKYLHFTQKLRRADGSTFLAEIASTPLFDHAGRYDGAVSIVNDVTARNEAQNQARLQTALLNTIGEAVALTTPDATLLYINPAAERLFGWRATDAVGQNGRELFTAPDDAEETARILAEVLTGNRYSGRFKLNRRDGSQFLAALDVVPVSDGQGAPVGLVGVINDLTEREQRNRDLHTRDIQVETLALLGAHALRQRPNPSVAATIILAEAVDATRRVLHADQACVFDLTSGGRDLKLRAAAPQNNEGTVAPGGSRSFPGYIALARKVVVVDDARRERRFDFPATPVAAPASAIGAPIFGPGGIVGVLTAESSTRNAGLIRGSRPLTRLRERPATANGTRSSRRHSTPGSCRPASFAGGLAAPRSSVCSRCRQRDEGCGQGAASSSLGRSRSDTGSLRSARCRVAMRV
jgi:PAS domain S-box-containing protein